MDAFMTILKGIGFIIHLIIKIALLPVQIILSVLVYVIDFAGGIFDKIFGLVGGFIIIGAIRGLFCHPIDWKLFAEGMIGGSLIGAFPRLVCLFGESALVGIIDILANI